jgi:hypothetical protein
MTPSIENRKCGKERRKSSKPWNGKQDKERVGGGRERGRA